MIGQYSLFTYIAPLLLEVTQVDPAILPWVLLLFGVGSTIGVFIGGRLADWKLMPSLIGIMVSQALMYVAIYFASPFPLVMAVAVIAWGGVNFAFGSPVQSRVLAWAADAPNLASALIPTGFNIGIAIGAVLGSGHPRKWPRLPQPALDRRRRHGAGRPHRHLLLPLGTTLRHHAAAAGGAVAAE